jgi:thioredoxin 1
MSDPWAGTVLPVTDATYVARVVDNPEPVLLAFTRYGESGSRALSPVLSEVAQRRAGSLTVATADVDANPQTAARWGVTHVPVMVLLRYGSMERVLIGVRPADRLLDEIDEAFAH